MPRHAEPINILAAKGRSHKTKAEKEARATAEAALKIDSDKIDPPKWLRKKAKELFIDFADQLLEIKLMTNADVPLLAMYCDAYCRYQTERDPKVRKQQFDQMAKAGAELGLSPAARAKLAMPKKEPKKPTADEKRFGNV